MPQARRPCSARRAWPKGASSSCGSCPWRPGPTRPTWSRAPAAPDQAPPPILDRRDRTERTFLALCIALPAEGARALKRVDLERHFTSSLARRAAAHLREHLTMPLDGIAEGDAEMRGLL